MLVQSPVNYISKINLKKRISRRNIKEFLPDDVDFRVELALAYQDIGYESAICGKSYQFYEYASFLIEDNDSTARYRLHIGETVTIITEDENQNFAILRSIFSHQRNDQRFAFIIVDWFETTNQTKLECPVYKLQRTTRFRQIF